MQRKYGGLNGLFITGEPGLGKSAFIKRFLEKEGFKDSSAVEGQMLLEDNSKIFYNIVASLPMVKKERVADKSF